MMRNRTRRITDGVEDVLIEEKRSKMNLKCKGKQQVKGSAILPAFELVLPSSVLKQECARGQATSSNRSGSVDEHVSGKDVTCTALRRGEHQCVIHALSFAVGIGRLTIDFRHERKLRRETFGIVN